MDSLHLSMNANVLSISFFKQSTNFTTTTSQKRATNSTLTTQKPVFFPKPNIHQIFKSLPIF